MRSYTACTRWIRSEKATSRRPARASAWGSRSRPTSVSRGWAASRAAAWPPSPRVASTRTAGRSRRAGSRSSATRGRRTGTCLAPAGPPAASASGCCPTAHLPPRAVPECPRRAPGVVSRRDRSDRPADGAHCPVRCAAAGRATAAHPPGGRAGTTANLAPGKVCQGRRALSHGIREGARAVWSSPPRPAGSRRGRGVPPPEPWRTRPRALPGSAARAARPRSRRG